MIEIFHPFVISFIFGLLIGIERERSHPKGAQAMGVRTFAIIALLGTLAAWIKEPVLTLVISVFVLGAILAGYFRSTAKHKFGIGITTELSAGVVYCLGYIAPSDPLLSAILGAVVLLVLLGKKKLHRFSRNQLHANEIQAAVTILIIGLGVFPFLPNHAIDPWQLFNPRLFCVLVLVISILQFGGYIAIRIFGQRLGTMLMGFLGGLVSSTAVFAHLSKTVRDKPELLNSCVIAAVLATGGSLIELSIVLSVVSPQLVSILMWPVMAAVGSACLFAFLWDRRNGKEHSLPSTTQNPLDFKSVLKISFFLAGMLIAMTVVNRYVGVHGAEIAFFLGGVFELHSTSLAAAVLYSTGKIPLAFAGIAVFSAITGSFLSKFVLLWTLNRGRFAMLTSLVLLVMLMVGGAIVWIS